MGNRNSFKILVLSLYYPPDLCAGSFRCVALVKALRALGHEVEVLTTCPNRYATFDADTPEQGVENGVNIHRIQMPSHQSGMLDQAKAFLFFAKRASRYVKGRQYDLVFATSSRLMTATLGAWIAQRLKLRLYLDIRDIFVDTLGDVLSRKVTFFIKPFFSKLEKLTVSRAVHVNLVSKGFEPYFKARYPAQAFSYFSNGVDDAFIRTGLNTAAHSESKKRLEVVYAGNIGEGQGLHIIVPPLAKKMEGRVEFKIIGDGGCRQKLTEALERLKCTNVTVLPPVARDALILAYEEADVLFLHLNDYPAFCKVLPSKLFEYAALGKPIWGGLSGYSATFVREEISNAALFHPGQVDEAVEAFSKLTLISEERGEFVDKFARDKIMDLMACDISRVVVDTEVC